MCTPDDKFIKDYRKALSVAGLFVARVDRKRAISFLCKEHSARDCPKCFNWEKLVKANARKRDAGKVEDRDRLLHLLSALHVSFPGLAKLVTPALEKKLMLSLDYAQRSVLFSDLLPLNPTDLTVWRVCA